MQALSYATQITAARETSTGVALFDGVCRSIERGRLNEGLDDLFNGLARIRDTMDSEAWRAFVDRARAERKLSDVLYQDPLTRRAFDKPRGYAGDAIMMDYAYGIHSAHEVFAQASDVGRVVYRYLQNAPAAQAVRNRREHIAQLIDEIAAETPRPAVLAIASGHLREAELSAALACGAVGKFVALDADAESLREVDEKYSSLGVETVHASVRHILARKVRIGRFDCVYAAGLYDYLNDSVATALTARMFELTTPGGHVLIPNFAPCCRDRAYLEAFGAWDLIYRDEFDMSGLMAGIPAREIASYDIYSDPSRSIVYLKIKKGTGQS